MSKSEQFLMGEPEDPQSPRVRRLRFMAEALDGYLPPDWAFVLIVGKPGDADTVNLVSNAPPAIADALLEVMEITAGKRTRRPL